MTKKEPCLARLYDYYKAVIGACCSLETTDEGFVLDYTVTGNKLDYIAFLWPSQIKALECYGDHIFIGSAFGVSTMDYKALNVVVVDKHFRSVLAATAFVDGEKIVAYKKLLAFINEKVRFKRLPLCLISDAAPQIHASVAEVYPFCRHIYCAFHLCKEELKFGRKKMVQKVVRLLKRTSRAL